MVADALATLKAGLELAEATKLLLERDTRSTKDKKLSDRLCTALRALYFTPNGIIELLKEIESGNKLTKERLEDKLPAFNDREWNVVDALDALDFERLQHELGLNLRTTRILEEIRIGKNNLRREIQREVNYYGRPGVHPNRQKVKHLILGIEKLNTQIEDIEWIINSRV